MDASRLDELLEQFPRLHVVVVGDFFLDKYLHIDPALSEISLETGLEAHQVVKIRHSPGAAGTVVIGQDGEGFELRHDLQQLGVRLDGLIEASDRFTPTYTKPMARQLDGSERELNRLDIKNRQPLPVDYETAVIAYLERLAPVVDGIIIADQVQERNCGVITDGVRAALARLAKTYPAKPIAADSRVRIGEFEQIIIKPNIHEAEAALQTRGLLPDNVSDSGADLDRAKSYGPALFQKSQKPVFVTLGAQGILAISSVGIEHVLGVPVSGKIDIVGAGDSVMAGLMAGLCAGASVKEAATIGNLAASITIQQLGTTGTASRAQLRQRLAEL